MSVTQTRRLLSRLSAMMAQGQVPLDRVVAMVAGEMVAEVCSAYGLRAGEILELRATHGLHAEAVGRTRLRVGEGIVGLTAATGQVLNLPDAQNHPGFAYRPETGEALYASMLAVPIRRAGRLLGVLCVQNRMPRRYADDEVEVLETVALLLGEMLAAGAIDGPGTLQAVSYAATLSQHFDGAILSGGIAIGPVILAGSAVAPVRVLADNPAHEQGRFAHALAAMRAALDVLIAGNLPAGESARDVMAATRQVAADDGWLRRVSLAIGDGLTADAAVHRVLGDMRDRMRRVSDPYLRERLADLEDLAGRLLAALNPGSRVPIACAGSILLARRLGPAEMLAWHANGIAGVVIEEGSAGGHAAILARALSLPVLGATRGAVDAAQLGDIAVIDGDQGVLVLRPTQGLRDAYEGAMAARAARAEGFAALRDAPSCTLDGVAFQLHINAGLAAELGQLGQTGAAGVGLFRTEIAMMARGAIADSAEQTAFYARVLDIAGGLPVVFRTLDLGSDKLLPDSEKAVEENPAMGWRSLRVGLDRPAVLRRQLRALLLAAGGRPLSVMFPMVANIAEFRRARALLLAEAARVRPAPQTLAIGTMLEIPALLFQLNLLMAEADFVSVGSNDLLQFMFAADRGTPELADRYDFISPPMLDMLDTIVAAAQGSSATLSLCGEAAARPLDALVLVALGFERLSMSASALLAVKSALMRTDMAAFRGFFARLRRTAGADESLREPVAAWARDHGIDLAGR